METRKQYKTQSFLEWMYYIKSNYYTSAKVTEIANREI